MTSRTPPELNTVMMSAVSLCKSLENRRSRKIMLSISDYMHVFRRNAARVEGGE